VDSTPTRVDPKEVLVAKLVANRAVEDLDGGGDKDPAPRTDFCFRAATADGVVIRHIDIEHELALEWFEGGGSHSSLISWLRTPGMNDLRLETRKWIDTTHSRAVHGPNLKPSRVEGTYLLFQFICVRKGVVAEIHVALERKREFAIDKKSRGSLFVIEPMEYGFKRVQAPIECKHRFRGEAIVMYRHLRWGGGRLGIGDTRPGKGDTRSGHHLRFLTRSYSIPLGCLLPWGTATLRGSLEFPRTQRSPSSFTSYTSSPWWLRLQV